MTVKFTQWLYKDVIVPVSYTHLDVYKRQLLLRATNVILSPFSESAQKWLCKFLSHKIYLANTTLNNSGRHAQVCATTYEIRLTLRSKIRVNEPVIAKCTWNNSLVLVFFTNDITLYSNTAHKRHIPIYSQKQIVPNMHVFYASGRSPIYLNINKNYRLFNPPK